MYVCDSSECLRVCDMSVFMCVVCVFFECVYMHGV